jgi:hypothetical protein
MWAVLLLARCDGAEERQVDDRTPGDRRAVVSVSQPPDGAGVEDGSAVLIADGPEHGCALRRTSSGADNNERGRRGRGSQVLFRD